MSNKKIAGVSLLIALILLWIPWFNHSITLGIASVIILLNSISKLI